MKYILMMLAPYGDGDYWVMQWDRGDLDAHIEYMKALNEELVRSGELVTAEGLAPPKDARLVRAEPDGAPMVTDGPFAEAREFVAGFWIVDVDTPERAHAIAARASRAPGPGGEPLYLELEVRPVMEAPSPSDEPS